MPTDPIMAELRSIREAHAASCNYDISAIFRDIRETQEGLGPEYVRRPQRRKGRLEPAPEPIGARSRRKP